ncbi:MAG: transposase [Desulfovibrio sp.]|jgi:hypothetical protein|nr:transposase [Desulfovibrio sp.]
MATVEYVLRKNSLVFIDESSAKTNMNTLRGRALRGEHCHGRVPGSWQTTTMISSIRVNGSTECIVFEGAIERRMFRAYMRESLLPVLKRGDIVVLDNPESPLLVARQALSRSWALPAFSLQIPGE